MSSTHHMSKKSKLNDVTPQVMFEYSGHEEVPKNVTHVRFHPSVVDVENQAFERYTKLREVVLNDGLREIGNYAFEWCTSLQSINIPSTVTKIDNAAFHYCSNLRVLVLNDGIREIGDRVFHSCESLPSITIPSTVTKIGDSAFSYCENLRTVVLNEGIKKIGCNIFQQCTALRSVTIPSTVDEIDQYSFMDCTNLQEVVLNDGIKRIKTNAFYECTSIEHITIPSTVIEIGTFVFWGCSGLREVVMYNEELQFSKAFIRCTSFERFSFPNLSTRLDNVIQAGQRDIEAKMDDVPAVEWRGGELIIPALRREIQKPWGMDTVVELDKEKLDKIKRLIAYYEMKEATTLFELALWNSKINQAEEAEANINRNSHRVEVPGPVKETILQYLR